MKSRDPRLRAARLARRRGEEEVQRGLDRQIQELDDEARRRRRQAMVDETGRIRYALGKPQMVRSVQLAAGISTSGELERYQEELRGKVEAARKNARAWRRAAWFAVVLFVALALVMAWALDSEYGYRSKTERRGYGRSSGLM